MEKVDVEGQFKEEKPFSKQARNFVGFWVLGLCNNYAYVIMLSAAFDILSPSFHQGHDGTFKTLNTTNTTTTLCNTMSTGAILVADILPSLLIKVISPFININTNLRVFAVVSLSASSFIITSTATKEWMTFLGVTCASLSSGLGEVTFLSYSSYFERNVISAWASGTGGAGVFGTLSYAALKYALSTRYTLLVMLIIPAIMALAFWVVIDHSSVLTSSCGESISPSDLEPLISSFSDLPIKKKYKERLANYSFKKKISLFKPLLKYMVPLGLVYFAEYFINQGLMELLYFPQVKEWLAHEEQYRWYQVDYQIGVFISRSSINLFQIQSLWILPILQVVNVIFLLFQVCYSFLPSIWIILAVIFYEGMLGGFAYVNTLYKLSIEVPEDKKAFSMGIVSLGDTIGIALAGFLSIPVHSILCKSLSKSLQ